MSQQVEIRTRGTFVKSNDTRIVEHILRDIKPGEVCEYDELSKALGRDVREHCPGNLAGARASLAREGVYFDALANVGLKRLTPAEVVEWAVGRVRRARRQARNGGKAIASIELSELTAEQKTAALATATQLAVLDLFGGAKASKRIAAAVGKTAAELPLGKTLSLFQ